MTNSLSFLTIATDLNRRAIQYYPLRLYVRARIATTSRPAQSTHHDHVWDICHQTIGRHRNHCKNKFETYVIRTQLNFESISRKKIITGPTGLAVSFRLSADVLRTFGGVLA